MATFGSTPRPCNDSPVHDRRPDHGRLSALDWGTEEVAVLTIARHYFTSFAVPHRHGWMGALGHALRVFGDDRGPAAAFAVLSMVQAMRSARQSPFNFNSADCPNCADRLTGNERTFMSALRALMRGDEAAANAHAALLCEGNDPLGFVVALQVVIRTCLPTSPASNGLATTPVH